METAVGKKWRVETACQRCSHKLYELLHCSHHGFSINRVIVYIFV